mgnify:FL=1
MPKSTYVQRDVLMMASQETDAKADMLFSMTAEHMS